MALIYRYSKDVNIDDAGVQQSTMNQVISKLIDNDNTLLIDQDKSPKIWECTWFNDNSICGYDKGDSVWLNTEDIDTFVVNRYGDIYDYAQANPILKKKFQDLSGDVHKQQRNLLCKQIVQGYGNLGPLYYIGELSDSVQIRISTVDNNKSLPTDDRYWEDFFIHYTDDQIELSIYQLFQEQLSELMNLHLINYHLSGMYSSLCDLSSTYLLADMSNITNKQQFYSHKWYVQQQSGFDHVKKFITIHFSCDSKSVKWFRIWDSGLLEHGGIVSPSQCDCYDDIVNGQIMSVNLQWPYNDNSDYSIVYDYPSPGFDGIYRNESKIQSFDGTQESIASPDIGISSRYSVNVTRLGEEVTEISQNNIGVYDMNNSHFGFMFDNQDAYYSYYIRGYTSLGKDL